MLVAFGGNEDLHLANSNQHPKSSLETAKCYILKVDYQLVFRSQVQILRFGFPISDSEFQSPGNR